MGVQSRVSDLYLHIHATTQKAKLENLQIMQIEGGGQHSVLLGSATATK